MLRKFAMTFVPVVALAATAACAPVQGKPADEAKPSVPVREHGSVTGVAPAKPGKSAQPAKPADLLSAISADLAQRLKVKPSELEVVAVEPVVWNDSSLGCPQPDQSYLMAQTPGVRVLFRNSGKTYQYHASDSGNFIYCENPAAPVGAPDKQ